MYVTDYMLVNGHFSRLLAAISEFLNGSSAAGHYHILPSQ
jgi:hypothetical protein